MKAGLLQDLGVSLIVGKISFFNSVLPSTISDLVTFLPRAKKGKEGGESKLIILTQNLGSLTLAELQEERCDRRGRIVLAA